MMLNQSPAAVKSPHWHQSADGWLWLVCAMTVVCMVSLVLSDVPPPPVEEVVRTSRRIGGVGSGREDLPGYPLPWASVDSSSWLSGAAAGAFEESELDSFDAAHQLPQPDSGKIIPRANASHVVRFMTVSCLMPNGTARPSPHVATKCGHAWS